MLPTGLPAVPYSCLDHLARLPTVDVAAVCARDAIDVATFRAHGVVSEFGAAGAMDRLVMIGEALAGAIVLLRLAAFLAVAGRVVWDKFGPAFRRLGGPKLRTLVEQHRGRPADVGGERADPS